MDIRQVEYVVGVVDEGGFTRAADVLHVAQPSLSQSVRRLEAELGVALFDRVGRGFQLTAAGRAFLGPARQLLRDRDLLHDAVAAVAHLRAGRLDLVALPTLAADPLAAFIGSFRRQHPGIAVHVDEPETTADLVAMILDGRCEIGVTDLATGSDLVHVPIRDEELFAVFPPGTPPAPAIGLRALAETPLVAGPLGTSTRDLVEQAFLAADLAPAVAVESGNREAIVPLVLAGAGAAVLHASAASRAAERGAVRMAIEPRLTRRIGLVHGDRPLSPAATRFVELVRSGASAGIDQASTSTGRSPSTVQRRIRRSRG
ncbi:MAG TPA: LysR family transcriptional regulator [Acidimicrobiales bacterium]|jgi:DNA-binding transcriptional LysR family regulator|nr:LysR family transcriptional regulator [Acidimicrobiales bacterium]